MSPQHKYTRRIPENLNTSPRSEESPSVVPSSTTITIYPLPWNFVYLISKNIDIPNIVCLQHRMTIPCTKLPSRVSGPKLTHINQDIGTRDTTVRRRTLDRNRTEEE